MAHTKSSSSAATHRGLSAIVEREADRTVVWLRGEHDVSTVAVVSETLAQAIALDEADLVVDLSGAHLLGAETVGVMSQARVLLGLRSRALVLRSPSTSVRRVLDLSGLGDLVEPGPMDAMSTTRPGRLATNLAGRGGP